jgi:magnesium-transporting ATPase (P-type)
MRLIPLDLLIHTEIGKIAVSKMIEYDHEMIKVDEQTGDLISCKIQSLQLPEELGAITHIFSDKTGTLTKNELVFRGISFSGHLCQGRDTMQILEQVHVHNSLIAEMLFKCFVICHDVIPMNIKGKIVMSGTSQDELVVIDVAS